MLLMPNQTPSKGFFVLWTPATGLYGGLSVGISEARTV